MFGDGLEREKLLSASYPGLRQSTAEYDYERIVVWANKGFAGHFAKIPGVLTARIYETDNKYLICIDPRYNLQWIMREIEATIKIKKPIIRRKKKEDEGDDD